MRDIVQLIQAFKDATKAMEDLCSDLQKEYQDFREQSRLILNDWHTCRYKRNYPHPESFVLVRRDNEIKYAYYVGERRFLSLEAHVRGEMLQSYILEDYFTDGDEWIEIRTLKK